MKTTKKQINKFQLDAFEVAKIKNMKVIKGGDGQDTIDTLSTRDCKTLPPDTVITK